MFSTALTIVAAVEAAATAIAAFSVSVPAPPSIESAVARSPTVAARNRVVTGRRLECRVCLIRRQEVSTSRQRKRYANRARAAASRCGNHSSNSRINKQQLLEQFVVTRLRMCDPGQQQQDRSKQQLPSLCRVPWCRGQQRNLVGRDRLVVALGTIKDRNCNVVDVERAFVESVNEEVQASNFSVTAEQRLIDRVEI